MILSVHHHKRTHFYCLGDKKALAVLNLNERGREKLYLVCDTTNKGKFPIYIHATHLQLSSYPPPCTDRGAVEGRHIHFRPPLSTFRCSRQPVCDPFSPAHIYSV
eukprot:GEMP01101884.1.p1 GENE.GEMP01101884.1~~GEMP01101884.1.p1  ORF type:complete len:105 (-),score=1.24 GEMP01101884.1:270-584(-)